MMQHLDQWLEREADPDLYEDAEPETPEDEDITTTDWMHWYCDGRLILDTSIGTPLNRYGQASERTWQRALDAWMHAQGFYPNVWFISDHGNPHLLTWAHV